MGAIAAGIGAGAGLIQAGLGFGAASAQRAWEERMANTQYQRGVADMRKAGLNPALMFGSGSPAPTPNVPVAQTGDVASSVMQGLQLQKQLALLDAQRNQANNQAFKSMQEGLVTAQDLIESGGKSLHQQWLEAATQGLRMGAAQASSAAALNRAALPGAGIRGSKVGGIIDLIRGGVSSAAGLGRMLSPTAGFASGSGMSPAEELEWLRR